MGEVFCAFDLETTGFSPKNGRILEIGAVLFDRQGHILGKLGLLVNPGTGVPWPTRKLTHINDAMVRWAVTPEEAVAQFSRFCQGAQLVGHGCDFDLRFLAAVDPSFAGRPLLDTLDLANLLLPQQPDHKLEHLTAALKIPHVAPHRAWSDADATRLLFQKMIQLAEQKTAAELTALRGAKEAQKDGVRRFLTDVVTKGLTPQPRAPIKRLLQNLGTVVVRHGRAEPLRSDLYKPAGITLS